MKANKGIKVIALVIAIASMFTMFSGCGNTYTASAIDEIKFRDIPLGTKYADVIPTIEDDLKGQGYSSDPEIEEYKEYNAVVATYDGIKLFDFNDVEIGLLFFKDDDLIDNARLVAAEYYIPFENAEKTKECYDFFNDKLTDLYGEKTSFVLYPYLDEVIGEVDGWTKGNTSCTLSASVEHNPRQALNILYSFLDPKEQMEKSIKSEEKEIGVHSNGTKDKIEFRDIPFGTKYADVIPAIEEDLRGQGYNTEPEVQVEEEENRVSVIFDGIKLFDYDEVDMTLFFLKEYDEKIEDAIFTHAWYDFDLTRNDQPEKARECYNYFNEKLIELYGEKTKIVLDGDEYEVWRRGNTLCYINDYTGAYRVLIAYGFIDTDEQYENSIKSEEERKAENANKGL